MADLLPVAEALALVLDGAGPLSEELALLAQCDGRVLARDVASRRTQPPAAMSAMDGYAIRAAETPGAFRVVGEAAAGRPFAGTVGPGEAARIFTGAPVPAGADAVCPQEETLRDGDLVRLSRETRAGRFVRPAGLDFTEGVVALRRGERLNPRSLGLAAAMNQAALPVIRRPRVAILSTGDELVAPGESPGEGQIVSSNAVLLAALLARDGVETVDLGICPDQLDVTRAALARARDDGFDVLITSGGASVGDHDQVRAALAAEGARLDFWRIAMRPGKPLMVGRLGPLRVVGLPGNPVASFVCAEIFLRPLMRRLCGLPDAPAAIEEAVLGADLPANDERADHLRARLATLDGRLVATPHPVQDSSMIRVLAEADALVLRPPFDAAKRAGDPCRILRLDR